jgi:hypothetical protein
MGHLGFSPYVVIDQEHNMSLKDIFPTSLHNASKNITFTQNESIKKEKTLAPTKVHIGLEINNKKPLKISS